MADKLTPAVVNLRGGGKCDMRICRPTRWGNPFVTSKQVGPQDARVKEGTLILVDSADDSIREYAEMLVLERRDLMVRLGELTGRTLGCWCAPNPCHGDVLVEWWEEWQAGRVCRVCGCTEISACDDGESGCCSWIEFGLCSNCVTIAGEAIPGCLERQWTARELVKIRKLAWERLGVPHA